MTIKLSDEIEAALAVLDKHGYTYGPPEMFQRAFATSHALGFKAGIEAGAAEVGRYMRLGRAGGDLAHAITSLPTPPSLLPEILETMRPFAKIARSYPDECGDDYRVSFEIDGMGKFYEHWTVGDLRAIAAAFTKLGGNIDEA